MDDSSLVSIAFLSYSTQPSEEYYRMGSKNSLL